jgi:subtilisin family serine protease
MALSSLTKRLRPLLVLGSLLCLALSLPQASAFGPFAGSLLRAGQRLIAWEEAASPDCGAPPIEPFPARQRARQLAQLGVDRWHQAGITGKGIKIAILDSGFRGYRAHLGRALPQRVIARSFRADGNLEAKDSQHGILCGEILHALAPSAELLLANWDPDSPRQFLDAVRWARQQGAQIITCSLIMPSWSDGEGGGPIHATLADIVGKGNAAGDILCFASAGNTAKRHWSGTFHAAKDGYHEWQAGQTSNRLTPWGCDRISVELCWQPGARYRLSVYDLLTGNKVGHVKTECEPDRCCTVVRYLPEVGHLYQVRVRLVQGKPGRFHVVALGGDLEYTTLHGSIPFPGDGTEVLAIGAVDSQGRRAPYSSCGPNSSRPKPDLVEPVPFPSLWRPRPFTGTSAAAPQAAALAALCWSGHRDWTAAHVRDVLMSAAQPLGPRGHSWETGNGLAVMPIDHIPALSPPIPAARAPIQLPPPSVPMTEVLPVSGKSG